MKYNLMYFNNEQDLFKVTYMTEDLGNGLQIKAQDEIIEDEQFVDALTSPSVSTVPNNDVVSDFWTSGELLSNFACVPTTEN
ncbi:hypothetical protein RhiirA4_463187 [Rhizophagus irregularis]|uniref:Uncharacterized protein n=1 Tax=Rhizophagus irregularis TaxID=588596 RepID=A0A2I1GMF4_9GLOM|nr:hypothetical protein RhiirA4_463187 [Rhizophagus irregularis]